MEQATKKWIMSKIIWLNVVSVSIDLLNYVLTNPMFPTKYAGLVSMAVGILTIVLRSKSNTVLTK